VELEFTFNVAPAGKATRVFSYSQLYPSAVSGEEAARLLCDTITPPPYLRCDRTSATLTSQAEQPLNQNPSLVIEQWSILVDNSQIGLRDAGSGNCTTSEVSPVPLAPLGYSYKSTKVILGSVPLCAQAVVEFQAVGGPVVCIIIDGDNFVGLPPVEQHLLLGELVRTRLQVAGYQIGALDVECNKDETECLVSLEVVANPNGSQVVNVRRLVYDDQARFRARVDPPIGSEVPLDQALLTVCGLNDPVLCEVFPETFRDYAYGLRFEIERVRQAPLLSPWAIAAVAITLLTSGGLLARRTPRPAR
jgi:hypothetical protein